MGFSLEKAYLLHGALWGMHGVGEHDTLPVLSYVSCMGCIVRQKSQVWLRTVGMTAVETESLSSPTEESGSNAGSSSAASPSAAELFPWK